MAAPKKPAPKSAQTPPKPAAKPTAKAAAPAAKPAAAKPAAVAAKPAAVAAKPAAVAAKPAAPKPAAAPTAAKSPAPTKAKAADAKPSVAALIAGSEAVAYRLLVLGADGPQTYADGADEIVVAPPTLFAVAPDAPSPRRYHFLLQKEDASGWVVLLHVVDGAAPTRVPAAPGWQRAIVNGTVHVIASDFPLSREDIVALIGGHEPPPSSARPPYS